jgi:Carboxypeptidase regulatory-like domain
MIVRIPRLVTFMVIAGLVSASAVAQDANSQIQGRLASARGPLSNVEVRITNAATGVVTLVSTTAQGEFSVPVPPGTYDVFATPAGYIEFARRQLEVGPGANVRVEGILTDNPNAGTPGEIFWLYAREGHAVPTGPTPRMADGKPDLSGVWLPGADLAPEVPPFQPWADTVAKQHASRPGDDPRARCLPSGVARTNGLDLAKFVHTPQLLVILVEGSVPGMRQVFLDGRPHPADPSPTWLGHSVGTWDRDTLVIDSVGFNDKGWLDVAGRPQTEKLHIIERLHRLDLGHLELDITIDDPGAYTRPWHIRRLLELAPHEEIQEYICNENQHSEHFGPN